MIQDIAPHTYHNEYLPREAKDDDLVLGYGERTVFLKENQDTIQFLPVKEYGEGKREALTYLFTIDETAFYLAKELKEETFPGYSYVPLSRLRTAVPGHLAFAGVTGSQLARWYQSHTFCGKCGSPMKKSDKERMLYCENCRHTEYPKISPAVIVAVRNQDQLLLTKYEGREYKRYALIAGFSEIGESVEDTVRREVMEEVGLKVKNLKFYKSQPWSFTDTLLMGFYCDLDGDATITLDRQELSVGEWRNREEIPDEGENISLTKEMMMRFKHHQD
ncbi:NADH pyrophosphatase [Blautia sp. An249]|uniref:NAD(+) diphosphatase n=1 Tax=Blautia sp. An249 TaxID=1965603 RepID=UPI000B3732A4|nr:NAD(+) diphosphatase [Blautia sp. An249]OUO80309.1 NADH pyrophosphatase [Blautia sp. An249]